jgi:hypothetical protein
MKTPDPFDQVTFSEAAEHPSTAGAITPGADGAAVLSVHFHNQSYSGATTSVELVDDDGFTKDGEAVDGDSGVDGFWVPYAGWGHLIPQATAVAVNPSWLDEPYETGNALRTVLVSYLAAEGVEPPAVTPGKIIFRNRLYV